MPKPYPEEFRNDVVAIARRREPGVTIKQIAADFGIHPMTLTKWLRQDRVEAGEQVGKTRQASAEERELRKRIRLLEQEHEVLRRPSSVSFCYPRPLPDRKSNLKRKQALPHTAGFALGSLGRGR